MDREKDYRYTEDGVLLVRKLESEKLVGFDTMFGCKVRWYQCSEADPDSQFLKVALGGWFGVFYLCDLISLFCGNYFYRKVTYVDEGMRIERRFQKIYYAPLEHRKRAALLFLLAVVIMVLAVCFVYQPIGKGLLEWLATVVSGQVTEETADQILRMVQ